MTPSTNRARRLRMWPLRTLTTYLAVWLLTYIAVMRLDFSHVASYFVLGWTGGGEIPASINLISIVLTALILAVWSVTQAIRRRKGGANGS